MAISQIPVLGHISLLLIELIFCRPGGRSTPPLSGDFTDSCSRSYFIPTLRTYIWKTRCWNQMKISWIPTLNIQGLIFGRPGGRSTPLWNGNFTDSYSDSSYWIPTLTSRMWQTRCWQIYLHSPQSNGNFTDSCSRSYFVPTLRAHIWQTRWQIYSPLWMAISQIPTLTAHIWFLLWQLICGRPGVGRSNPHHQTAITDSYSDSSYVTDKVLADLPPIKWQFHGFLLWTSSSSYLADQVADITLPLNGNFTDSHSESSYLIPTLTAHMWQTRCWQI